MKCTTKIVLGIIVAIFTLSIIFIIYAAIWYNGDERNYFPEYYGTLSYQIPQGDVTTYDLDSFQVLRFETVSGDGYSGRMLKGELIVRSQISETDKNQLVVPSAISRYINMEAVGDILKIRVDREAILELYKDSIDKKYESLTGLDMSLYLSDRNVKIMNTIPYINVFVDSLNADMVDMLVESGKIKVKSSKITHLRTQAHRYGSFLLQQSEIDTLTLDLDNINGWTITDSRIEVENLTGSGYHNVQQSKRESKVFNWIPKNKDAKLNMSVSDTLQVVFK